MNGDGPGKAILVVFITALLCSIMVTAVTVTLRPIQHAYQNLERNRFIIGISGLTSSAMELPDRDVVSLFQSLEARIVDLNTGAFDSTHNPSTFDSWEAATDPELSIPIPKGLDVAKLSRRSRLATVYLVRDGDKLQRIILPIYGQGMWSTIYGFIALEADSNTIADITFYKQAETAGIGDKILHPDWLAKWRGRKLFDENGTLRFRVGSGAVDPASPAALYEVDAISGATITVDAVADMVRYWFGPHGFASFLNSYRTEGER